MIGPNRTEPKPTVYTVAAIITGQKAARSAREVSTTVSPTQLNGGVTIVLATRPARPTMPEEDFSDSNPGSAASSRSSAVSTPPPAPLKASSHPDIAGGVTRP